MIVTPTPPVSGVFGSGGVIGDVPVEPPAMPLPNFGVTGPVSQLARAATLMTTAANRMKWDRMYFELLRRATGRHLHVALIDNVRGDEDQKVALRLLARRVAEETTDQRQIHENRDTGPGDTHGRLRQSAHDRGLAVGHEQLVVDGLRWERRADVAA